MNQFKIIKINEEITCINDDQLCSVYVVVGTKKALIIDTGMSTTPSLLNEIKKITNKELIVVLTHGHFDHTGHICEFDEIYMDKDDFECLIKQEELKTCLSKIKFVENEQEFDLGNYTIKVLKTPGHTQGSIVLIDEFHHILFTGDQFGSGCGVWMQVNEALPLSKYIESIENFKNYIINNYNYDYYKWNYLGGHLGQETTGRMGFNPLNSEMIENLKTLSQLTLEHKVMLQSTSATEFNNEKSYYVCYKNAEMVIRKSLIK